MIPILYEANERFFSTNGLGRLRDTISAVVTEERNSIYELDFQYPVNGAHFDEIIPGRIVAVTHDESGTIEPFDIVGFTKPIDGIVEFHCVHISYRLAGQVVWASNINSLARALNVFAGVSGTPFTYSADFTSSAYMAAFDGTPRTVRQLIGGIEGSILDTYGGELEWRGFNVYLHKARGVLRDFTIRYGVNLADYTDESDFQGTYTSCIPYWIGQDGDADVIVRGARVNSGLNPYNGRNDCIPLDLSDKFETKPTAAQLETLARTIMTGNAVNLPNQTIKVDFIRIQDSPEFAQMATLLQCNLCDTINVSFPMYNMEGTFKIVRTVWNVLLNKYDSMELGNLSTTLAEALGVPQETANTFNEGGAAAEDYITAKGTSGNFYYEKWASGKVTAIGYVTFASLTFTASNNHYRSVSNAFTIPAGIFTTAPQRGRAWMQGSNMVYFSATVGGMTTTGGNCEIWKSTSGNASNVSVHIELIYTP